MKKVIIFITSLMTILVLILSFNRDLQRSITIFMTLFVFALLASSYVYFEKKSSIGTKEVSLIGTLSGFIAVSRIIFAPIPNVKPVTFLVALCGYVFGPYEGFLIGSTSAFLSNIFFGQGPWTPWQMLSWGIIGIICGFLGKRKKELSTLTFSFACFLFGFLFDYIMNAWQVLGFVRPITLKAVLLVYASGVVFDLLHGVSSFVFSMIFYKSFLKVLKRYKRRLMIMYIKS